MAAEPLPSAEDLAKLLRSLPAREIVEKFRAAKGIEPAIATAPSAVTPSLTRGEMVEHCSGDLLLDAIDSLVQTAQQRVLLFSRKCLLIAAPNPPETLPQKQREGQHYQVLLSAAKRASVGEIEFQCALVPKVLRDMGRERGWPERYRRNYATLKPLADSPGEGRFRLVLANHDVDPVWSFLVADQNVCMWFDDPRTGNRTGCVSRQGALADAFAAKFQELTRPEAPKKVLAAIVPRGRP